MIIRKQCTETTDSSATQLATTAPSRRQFLQRSALGVGAISLTQMMSPVALGDTHRTTHFPGKAKHVIHVFLNGGMSQVDTFDPKARAD